MGKPEQICVQRLTAEGGDRIDCGAERLPALPRGAAPIDRIADERVPALAQVNADLVGSSGGEPALETGGRRAEGAAIRHCGRARAGPDHELHEEHEVKRSKSWKNATAEIDRESLYARPMHPYTVALMSAVPVPDTKRRTERDRIRLQGDVPSPINPPPACRFHTRCPKARDGVCNVEEPLLEPKEGGNLAACHYPLTDEEVMERVPTAAERGG